MLTSKYGFPAAIFYSALAVGAVPAFASDAASDDTGAVEGSAASDYSTSEIQTTQSLAPSGPALERAGEPIDEATASDLGAESGFSLSANIAFASEYRFRGVDLSGGEFAVQGGFDLSHTSGFYVGTWASNLDEQTVGYGSTELDVYGGWSSNVADGIGVDVGVIGYLYPDAGPGEFDYVEFYGSVSGSLGPASVTGGIAYAPDQDSLGGTDNLYLYTDASVGIPDTPVTINGHLGYTDGFLTFTDDSEAFDWSLGAAVAVGPLTVSGAYVGVEGDQAFDPGGVFTDDALVFTVSASF